MKVSEIGKSSFLKMRTVSIVNLRTYFDQPGRVENQVGFYV